MSHLFLKAENAKGRTVISGSSFTAPLKIAKPFYHDDYTEIIMMTASAGILEGDFYDIEINVMKNASLKFTGQSYTKIFKATDKGAMQRTKINVKSGASFLYCPMPIIPFEESSFTNTTEVYLDGNCHFVMYDILSCGRTAMCETFLFQSYRSRTTVYIDGKMRFLDNQLLIPGEIDLSGIGFFEGYSHMGMMYLYGYENIVIPGSEENEIAMTKASDGICVRAFSNSADEILQQFHWIISKNCSAIRKTIS